LLRHPDRNAVYERHWPGRIADVLIVRLVRRRRWIKRQLASRLKVQRLLCRTLWRPLIVLSPLVDAGVKHVRLWELHLSFVLEEVIEERQLDVLAIEDAGLVTKLSVAQRISISSRPAAVTPRAHHQDVEGLRVVLFYRAIDSQRAL